MASLCFNASSAPATAVSARFCWSRGEKNGIAAGQVASQVSKRRMFCCVACRAVQRFLHVWAEGSGRRRCRGCADSHKSHPQAAHVCCSDAACQSRESSQSYRHSNLKNADIKKEGEETKECWDGKEGSYGKEADSASRGGCGG